MSLDKASSFVAPYGSPTGRGLPDELLDRIIGSLYNSRAIYKNTDPKVWWYACSLVCKRWRNITLPYLYRSIGQRNTCPSPECECTDFFADTPEVAILVQELNLRETEIFDTDSLDCLLGALTSLRSLTVIDSTVEPCVENLEYASHKLRKFIYKDNSHEPLTQLTTFIHIFALFSEIDELHVSVTDDEDNGDVRPTDDDVERLAQLACDAQPEDFDATRIQIRKLRCCNIAEGGTFIPSYLCKLGVLSHLTHLDFVLRDDTDWEVFSELLSASHPTLEEVYIEIALFDGEEIDSDIAALQPRLSTCSSLQSFTIIIKLPYLRPLPNSGYYARHPDGAHICYVSEYHERWPTIVQLLQSIPPLAPLRHIKIGLHGTSTFPHVVDWHPFRQWCLNRISSESSGLQRIEIELWQAYDQRGCMEYEMKEVMKKRPGIFEPKYNLPDRLSVVYSGGTIPDWAIVDFECTDKGCRGYHGDSGEL